MMEDSDQVIVEMNRRLEGRHPGLTCLGIGFESVVYTDGKTVYKIFRRDPEFYSHLAAQLEGRFAGCKRFFDVHPCTVCGMSAVAYPYEESKAYTGGRREEMEEFLVESALSGIVFRDVKPINFRVFRDGLRFIDYGRDFLPFSETEFLYMCQRAFICLSDWSDPRFKDKAGRAQHTWDESLLDGFTEFFNSVYTEYLSRLEAHTTPKKFVLPENRWISSIIASNTESSTRVYYLTDLSKELIHADLSEIDDLTGQDMVIVTDYDHLPERMLERIMRVVPVGGNVGILMRNPYFGGDVNATIAALELHGLAVEKTEHSPPVSCSEGMTSSYLFLKCRRFEPVDDVSLMIKVCAQDTGVVDVLIRHLVSQLEHPDHFLEKLVVVDGKGEGFLRQYSDPDYGLLISKLDDLLDDKVIDRYVVASTDHFEVSRVNLEWFGIECSSTHSVKNIPVTPQLWGFEQCAGRFILQTDCDAIVVRRDRTHSYLRDMVKAMEDPDVLSVSFNISHDPESDFVPYSGSYCPEVRICLFDKQRLLDHRPYPNDVIDGRQMLSWYRSIERYQQETCLRSVRGGDPRSFYIHPPNSIKTNREFWMLVLDRAEHGQIPHIQYENIELVGNSDDWNLPKRREQFIFIICGRNISNERYMRLWNSLENQRCRDWGAVIIDDASDNGLSAIIDSTAGVRNHVTVIRNHDRQKILKNIVHAIRDICSVPESVIITLDMDDALTSRDALCIISKRYLRGHDLVSTTCLRRDKGIFPYPIDFESAHDGGRMGNVWLHTRSFRKYLFDALSPSLFKENDEWIDEFNELTFMVPISEMATSPIQVRAPLYLWKPTRTRDDDHYRMNEHTKAIVTSRPVHQVLEYTISLGRIIPPGMIVKQVSHGDIIVIRHAEKERVKLVPSSEPGITPRGEDDSRILGESLPPINRFLVSEVRRTGETAHCIREGNGSDADLIVEPMLNAFPRNLRDRIADLMPGKDYSETTLASCRDYSRKLLMRLLQLSEERTTVAITHDHMVRAMSVLFGGDAGTPIPYLGGVVLKREAVLKRLFELESTYDDFNHHTDIHSVEIDITYRCNMGCRSCDRSCGRVPSGEDMSLEQVRRFISESEKRNYEWKRIRIMGGEPFMHPDIESILRDFSEYAAAHKECLVEVYTNGLEELPCRVPGNISVHNTLKNLRPNRFDPYNLSPVDLNPYYRARGCWITTDCGVGFNVYGFYCCAAGAALDRLFGFGLASEWADDPGVETGKATLCKYCGHGVYPGFRSRDERPLIGEMDLISESWANLFSKDLSDSQVQKRRWGE